MNKVIASKQFDEALKISDRAIKSRAFEVRKFGIKLFEELIKNDCKKAREQAIVILGNYQDKDHLYGLVKTLLDKTSNFIVQGQYEEGLQVAEVLVKSDSYSFRENGNQLFEQLFAKKYKPAIEKAREICQKDYLHEGRFDALEVLIKKYDSLSAKIGRFFTFKKE